MSRWFRVDDGLVDDPKVQQLPDALFRAVVNLWCVTSQNGGKLPSVDQIAFKLRLSLHKTEKILDTLRRLNLIDDDDDGTRPHNWNGRQFKSDVSTERVKRFRERPRNVSSTVSETPPDTDTDTDTERKKDIRAVAVATRPDAFEDFWKGYPRRDGANPKTPARKKFMAAVKSGIEPDTIIAAAKRYSAHCQTKQQINTPYVAQAVTWLSQQRWGDYPEAKAPAGIHGPPSADLPTDEQLRRKYEALNEQRGRTETPQPPAPAERRADLEGNLLGTRPDDDSGDVSAGRCAGDLAGKPGVRRLADLLPRTLALAAVGIRGDTEG